MEEKNRWLILVIFLVLCLTRLEYWQYYIELLIKYPLQNNNGILYSFQTLIAGILALCAAIIGYKGLNKQILYQKNSQWQSDLDAYLSYIVSHGKNFLALCEWTVSYFPKNIETINSNSLDKIHDLRKAMEERNLKQDECLFKFNMLLDHSNPLHVDLLKEINNWFSLIRKFETKIMKENNNNTKFYDDEELKQCELKLLGITRKIRKETHF